MLGQHDGQARARHQLQGLDTGQRAEHLDMLVESRGRDCLGECEGLERFDLTGNAQLGAALGSGGVPVEKDPQRSHHRSEITAGV